jgi:hypothetical protein
VSLVEVLKAYMRNRSIVKLSLNRDTTWNLAVKFRPRSLYLRERPPIRIE